MSVLIRDSRTGIVTSTELTGSYLDLFLRQNPNYSLVGIATNANAIYYPLLNDSNLQFHDPFVQNYFVFNPGLTRLGIGTSNPQATLDVNGDIKSSGYVAFSGITTFYGPVYFYGDVNLDHYVAGIATITKRFDVGYGGTVFTVLNSQDKNIVGIGSTYSGNVGIGTTIPKQKLDVVGSVHISQNIYDSSNQSGDIGAFLTKDNQGIKWTTFQPSFSEGIFVYNEETLVGVQSFRGINLKTGRGNGINIDPIQGFVNPNNSNIADVYVYDYWDYNGSGDIYRSSKVGINNSSPSHQLDVTGDANITSNLYVGGPTLISNTLEVTQATTLDSTIRLKSSLYDVNNSAAIGKNDYRLSSVGTGVSWRPPGVQTLRTIWVTLNGNDSNSGLLEGDAKATIGAAASIAQPGDTIFIRSGVYYENNPIGLRTDVSISGQDLRLVTIVPNNLQKDIFHVRRGCLIENLSFSCSNISVANTGGGAVAFPPTTEDIVAGKSYGAVSGYIAPGPATEGPSGRWRSPYIRNCTNFMKESIGMKINGNHATALTPGNDLKCMVCDSFTQYNEAGIGVSITNNGYAQLVSIFTINCHIGIYCNTGGSCDITNSNSSFGDYGLYADGVGALEFTATTLTATTNQSDKFVMQNVKDAQSRYRTPYNGQAIWFQIPVSTGTLAEPMRNVSSVTVLNGGSGFSPSAPPSITVVDTNNNNSINPLGPQGIIAQLSPTIDITSGKITSIDVVSSGRNYLPTQNMVVAINGIPQSTSNFVVNMNPIYYTVSSASSVTSSGISTVTLNEFVPYLVGAGTTINMYRISRIQTSSHSFEYIGSGTDINTSNPFQGATYNAANEVVAINGALIPYTSTNQAGNFEIGKGIVIDQTTNTIRGRDFNRAIQANVTPLILALR